MMGLRKYISCWCCICS